MRITALVSAVVFLLQIGDAAAQPRIEVLRWYDASSPYLALVMRTPPGINDCDRDGIPDIVTRSSSSVFTCTGIAGTLWEFDAGAAGLDDPQFLGFLRLTAESGPATHAAIIDAEALHICELNNKNPDLMRYEPINALMNPGFTLRQRASGAEVAIVAGNNRIAVIGAVAGVRATGSAFEKPRRTQRAAYTLSEKFSGTVDERLGYEPDLFPLFGEMDLDDDGVQDLVTLKHDANGIPVGIIVQDGDTFDELWRWEFPAQYVERIMMGFHGFADADGDGVKELFCGDNLVVPRDGTVQELRANFRIRHLMDIDHDGLPDVIGRDQTAGRLLALGAGPATTVDALPSPTGMRLHPPHPNPSISGTLVSFTLEDRAPVRLEIHDLQGRCVRTLVDGSREAGTHHVAFDGADAAGAALPSGSYSIILTSAAASQRQGIIIVR